MTFTLEVSLPNGECETLQFNLRVTPDTIKNQLFNTVESLKSKKIHEYLLQSTELNHVFEIEFMKFLATTELQQKAERNEPIKVSLIERTKLLVDQLDNKQSPSRLNKEQIQKMIASPVHIQASSSSIDSSPQISSLSSKSLERSVTAVAPSSPPIKSKLSQTVVTNNNNENDTQNNEEKIETVPVPFADDSILTSDDPPTPRKQTEKEEDNSTNNTINNSDSTENESTNSEQKLEKLFEEPTVVSTTEKTTEKESTNTSASAPDLVSPEPLKKTLTPTFGDLPTRKRNNTGSTPCVNDIDQQSNKNFNDNVKNKSVDSFISPKIRARSKTQIANSPASKSTNNIIIPMKKSKHHEDGTSSTSSIDDVEIQTKSPGQSRTSGGKSGKTTPSGRFKNLIFANRSVVSQSRSLDSDPVDPLDSTSPTTTPPLPSSSSTSSFEPEPDWADASESLLIEPNQFGFHIEVGNKALSPAHFTTASFRLEEPDQTNHYELYFNKDHANYIGNVPGKIGPIIISCQEEKGDVLRALVRTAGGTEHYLLDMQSGWLKQSRLKNLLTKLELDVPRKTLKRVKGADIVKTLKQFDESHLIFNYKFGVLYCKEGQTDEIEWFGNEHGSDEFNEFLEIIGDRISLKNWSGFRGGLDVNGGSTGAESIFAKFGKYQIMFHVSTLLPFSAADEQKIERKRHLGNDIIVIIYKEGNTKFPAGVCKSEFNHVYVVVEKNQEDPEYYNIGVTIKDGVKPFGPTFPFPPKIHKSLLREFLLTKMLNGEWAAYRSLEFSHKFKRTRKEQLANIIKTYDC